MLFCAKINKCHLTFVVEKIFTTDSDTAITHRTPMCFSRKPILWRTFNKWFTFFVSRTPEIRVGSDSRRWSWTWFQRWKRFGFQGAWPSRTMTILSLPDYMITPIINFSWAPEFGRIVWINWAPGVRPAIMSERQDTFLVYLRTTNRFTYVVIS